MAVPRRRAQVLLTSDYRRLIAVLEQVPHATVAVVEPNGIASEQPTHHTGQGTRPATNGQGNVIVHPAPSQPLAPACGATAFQPRPEPVEVQIIEKSFPPLLRRESERDATNEGCLVVDRGA